jgi:hypothetical protein
MSMGSPTRCHTVLVLPAIDADAPGKPLAHPDAS